MNLLTKEIETFVKRQKLGYVATVSSKNMPNISPKGTIVVWDNDHICFADIRSPDTIRNLETNPNLEINVIDPFIRKGFLFKGKATILRSGCLYEKILTSYRASGVNSPIESIVLVNVVNVEQVFSPLYDMGASEESIKQKWTKYYLDY